MRSRFTSWISEWPVHWQAGDQDSGFNRAEPLSVPDRKGPAPRLSWAEGDNSIWGRLSVARGGHSLAESEGGFGSNLDVTAFTSGMNKIGAGFFSLIFLPDLLLPTSCL